MAFDLADTAYGELLASNVMTSAFGLPFTSNLNPHIYCAYVCRILAASAIPTSGDTIIQKYQLEFLPKCEKSSGLITTFPGGGIASHDDLYGASHLSEAFSVRALAMLERTDGVYSDDETDETKNVFRFLFVEPVIRANAQIRVGYWSQSLYAIHVLFSMFFTKSGDTSGLLLIWLSIPKMKEFPISGIALAFWSWWWTRKGFTPKSVFTNNYLTDYPWFGKWATSDWY